MTELHSAHPILTNLLLFLGKRMCSFFIPVINHIAADKIFDLLN